MVPASSPQAVPLNLLQQFASIEARMTALRHQLSSSSVLVSIDTEQEALIATEVENPSLQGIGGSQSAVRHVEVCLV